MVLEWLAQNISQVLRNWFLKFDIDFDIWHWTSDSWFTWTFNSFHILSVTFGPVPLFDKTKSKTVKDKNHFVGLWKCLTVDYLVWLSRLSGLSSIMVFNFPSIHITQGSTQQYPISDKTYLEKSNMKAIRLYIKLFIVLFFFK